jgi:hypothetical protein
MKTINERLEEFDKKFVYIDTELGEDTPREYKVKEFKNHFRTALTEQLDELEKEIDKLRYTGNPELETSQDFGVNRAISEVKQLIEDMKN